MSLSSCQEQRTSYGPSYHAMDQCDGRHSHPADTAMIWITQYGVPILVLLVITQWWSHGERLHVRHACIAAGLSFFIGLGLNQFILVFVHRVRPYEVGLTHLIISPSADGSFPSDHATATLAIASTFLLCRLPRLGFTFFSGRSSHLLFKDLCGYALFYRCAWRRGYRAVCSSSCKRALS